MRPYNSYYLRVVREEVERMEDGSEDLDEATERVRIVMMDADDTLSESAAQKLAEDMFEFVQESSIKRITDDNNTPRPYMRRLSMKDV